MRRLNQEEYAVLPSGRLNLTTGKNIHFNVIRDWKPGDCHLTLYSQTDWEGKTSFRVVAGFAYEEKCSLPYGINLAHDQTHACIGTPGREWKMITSQPNTLEGMAQLSKALGKNSVPMCVLK